MVDRGEGVEGVTQQCSDPKVKALNFVSAAERDSASWRPPAGPLGS